MSQYLFNHSDLNNTAEFLIYLIFKFENVICIVIMLGLLAKTMFMISGSSAPFLLDLHGHQSCKYKYILYILKIHVSYCYSMTKEGLSKVLMILYIYT